MYANEAGRVMGKGAMAGAGVVMLPATSGNTLGTILAYSAIAIGVTALLSQLAVRVVRRMNAQATPKN